MTWEPLLPSLPIMPGHDSVAMKVETQQGHGIWQWFQPRWSSSMASAPLKRQLQTTTLNVGKTMKNTTWFEKRNKKMLLCCLLLPHVFFSWFIASFPTRVGKNHLATLTVSTLNLKTSMKGTGIEPSGLPVYCLEAKTHLPVFPWYSEFMDLNQL